MRYLYKIDLIEFSYVKKLCGRVVDFLVKIN